MTKKTLIITLSCIFLFLPVSLVFSYKNRGSSGREIKIISPETQNSTSPEPSKTAKIYKLEYYLSLADSFFTKATRLANDNPNQTQNDKLNIINNINKSLEAINQACEYYPNRPEPYLTRAQIYQKITHLYPEAGNLAKNDLAVANQLMNKNNPTSSVTPPALNPLQLIPTEKAGLAKAIIIAEPNEEQKPNIKEIRELKTNAVTGTDIIPAGMTEVLIPCFQLTKDYLIYTVLEGDSENRVLSVIARKEGEFFKVGLDGTASKDLKFNWWLIGN